MDGKVTRFNSNKHSRIGFDSNVAAASSSVIVPNNFNPNHVRDSQDDLINVYKIKHEEHKENKRLFDQFTKLDKTPSNSSPSALVKVYPKRNRNQTNFFLTNHSSETNTRVTVNPHRNIDVVCVNDESLSVMTSYIHTDNATTISQTSNVVRKKKKRRNVLTNKSSKSPKTIKANDKAEERECPKCNIVKFF